jgi:hypothetical protein
MLKSSHCLDGKIADALALSLTCATATDALVNHRGYAIAEDLKTSHRPHETRFLLVVCREVVSLSWEAQCQS